MPDVQKEFRSALVDGMRSLIAGDARQRGLYSSGPGKLFGSNQDYGGGVGEGFQDFFTTGYDSVNGVTTVAFLPDFSLVDGTDIVTA